MEFILFFKKYILNPLTMGSFIPSSRFLGNSVFKIINSLHPCKIIEIGAGTGSITRSIQALEPVVIEIDKEFSDLLSKKFPNLQVVNRCAIEYLGLIQNSQDEVFGVVISVPLINNPYKPLYIAELNRLYMAGLLKWCIIYTYGYQNPLKDVNFNSALRKTTVIANFPPAHIWVYS